MVLVEREDKGMATSKSYELQQRAKSQRFAKGRNRVTVSESQGVFRFLLDFLSAQNNGRGEYLYPWKMLAIRMGGYLSRQSQSRLMTLGLLSVGLLGVAEWRMGSSHYFSLLHMIPMMLLTWFGGKRLGVVMSTASTVAGLYLLAPSSSLHLSSWVHYHDVDVRFGISLMIIFILWVMKNSLEHEKEFARTDVLTGIGNRRSFIEGAEIEIARARRHESPFTVIYMDVDNLKIINDTLGHSAGDRLLRSLAQATRKKLRATDLVARLGGDEFGLLLPETGPDVAELIVQRLQGIGATLMPKGQECVPFSMGVVTFLDPPSSVDEMLSISDTVMYTAKQNGKHTVCREIYSKESNSHKSVSPEQQRVSTSDQGEGVLVIRRNKPGARVVSFGR
jgi:diguanylate cyclase (GGDEF)-like protein